jgi:quinol monooxygenase YgiN
MYGLFGKMRAQPGQRDALIALLLDAAKLMPDIEGCYLYVIGSAPDDPDGMWVSEVWRSQEDHQASLGHETVKTIIASARPLIAGFGERFEFTPLGGKGLPDPA